METKNIFKLCLTLLLLAISLPAMSQTISVTIPNMSAETGTTVSIPINVSDVSGLNVFSYNITLTFDQQVLDATGITIGGTVAEPWGSPTFSDSNGQITIAGAGTSALSGAGVLLYVNFSVVGSPGAQTQISFTQMIFNEGDPAANATGSTFTISGGAQVVSVTIPNTSANAGESVAIPINVGDVSGLNIFSYNLILTFDQQVLDATGVSVSGTINEPWGSPTFSDGNGQITIAGAGTSALSGAGVLLYVNFSVVGSPGAQTQISFTQMIFNEGDPAANTSNGVFTIQGASAEWIYQNSGVSARLMSVDAVSNQIGWIAGRDATILRTADGGTTWSNVWNGPSDANFQSVEGMSGNVAFVTGWKGDYTQGTNIGVMYKTTDGGNSWNTLLESPGAWYNFIKMFDEQNGICIGDVVNGVWVIMKTSDGGNNWHQITNAPPDIDTVYTSVPRVFWLDNNTGFFGTNTSNYYVTHDGGENWSKFTIPQLGNVGSVAINSSNCGIASDYGGPLLRTTDGGQSWTEIPSPGSGSLRHIIIYNNSFWFPQGKTIYKSSDNGLSWQEQVTADRHVRYISFCTNQQGTYGWAVGNNGLILKYSSPGTAVEKSHDISNPDNFYLQQNYPNPFNPTTTIQFELPVSSFVNLKIFDSTGREVKTVLHEKLPAGQHKVLINANNLPSGMYFYKLEAAGNSVTKKFILLR